MFREQNGAVKEKDGEVDVKTEEAENRKPEEGKEAAKDVVKEASEEKTEAPAAPKMREKTTVVNKKKTCVVF